MKVIYHVDELENGKMYSKCEKHVIICARK